MGSRRKFIGAVATGLASTLASSTVLGANERLRVGVIGAGERGKELAYQALACPNVEIAAFADIYSKRLDDTRALVPAADVHADHRRLLDDQSLDAVIIATPQHLHCEHFLAAIQAGKHIYVEKTLAFTLEQANRMRAARAKASRQIVQVGHQACSSGAMTDALRFVSSGSVGKITAIQMSMYRNTPSGKPQWSRPVYPDLNQEAINWPAFLGDSTPRDFDANRYVNWRLFADYSGGSVFENMSQQLAFWYRALNLRIPNTATMTGGLYLWKDGREVPDTMSVTLEQPEEMLVSWNCGFGNNQLGIGEEVLGTHGTISRASTIRYSPQKVNRPDGVELVGRTSTAPTAHMQNFLDCIRARKEPNCPFDLAYRVSVACRMAVESYSLGRTVRWDADREAIL